MVIFYLILRAIFKAGQLCFATVFAVLFLTCCSTEVATPELVTEEGNPSDSIMSEEPLEEKNDSVLTDSIPADTIPEIEETNVLQFSDTFFDKDYWTSIGNSEEVSIRKPRMDSKEWFLAEPAFTSQGNDIYQGTCRMFGVYIQPYWDKEFSGRMRLCYIDDKGNVIGYTHTISISGNREKNLCFFDYITLPPGRMRILPVVQPEGETSWIAPVSSGYYNTWYMTAIEEHEISEWPDEDWGFDVKPEKDILMLRDMYNDGASAGDYMMAVNNIVGKNKRFQIHYILSNPSGKAKKGKLILKDEHGYKEQYHNHRPCMKHYKNSERDTLEWSHIIGNHDIEIPEGVFFWKGRIEGSIPYPNYVATCTGCQHLYFQPVGDNEQYLLIKDWRHVMYGLERGDGIEWGANITFMYVK